MSQILAFVMNPMEGININADTSFAFMLAGAAKGCRIFHVNPADLDLSGDRLFMRGRFIEVAKQQGQFYKVLEETRISAEDCKAIFIRTDPPFDEAYLTATWLLGFAERRGVRVINSPRGVRSANEKLYAMEFPELCPDTIVTSSRDEILSFVRKENGRAIAKPLDGFGGFGVVFLREGDSNLKALIELLTLEGKEPILVQQYLPGGVNGDKRLLLINGKIRGAVRRVPQSDDHRGNVHVGGVAQACELDESDRHIETVLGERLRQDGLYFVGIDVIDGKLIEVNVTSPTLVQEVRDLGGPDLAAEVIDSLF
jgi:glutathione synthase